nr:hypothetical protein GCM10020093_102490 [Planobispora longispora]
MLGQPLSQEDGQLLRLRGADDVGRQNAADRPHRRRLHLRMLGQNRLDLTQLHPHAADLHLVVDTAQIVDLTVRQPARQVPGPIQA